jgi:glycosyltransferase involved in cell wall biosynthesis
MKRLLVLSPAPHGAASTRFRLEQFFPALHRAGITPVLRPFLDEAGFGIIYKPGAPVEKLFAAVRSIGDRLIDLARASRADGVLIHREAALIGPPILEWLLARGASLPLVFDVDDAVWVPYSSPTYGARLSRWLKFPQKALFTLSAASRVICGNPRLAEFARRFNRNVSVVPTIVDTDTFRPAPRSNPVPVIGWIGTHSSLQYLRMLVPVLRRLAERRRFRLQVVGGDLAEPGLPIDQRQWTLAREIRDFQALDIGLYPLAEDEWALGKSGFKAIQYMACGVPVVASPVGVTNDIIEHGHNGFLARSLAEWEDYLERLLDDAELRTRLGERGRRDAVGRWSLARYEPRFVDLIKNALEPS